MIPRLGDPRKLSAHFLTWLLPEHAGNRARAEILRRLGVPVGEGTDLAGSVLITGPGDVRKSFSIGAHCAIGGDLVVDLSAPVRIGDHVGMGRSVRLITGDHDIGPSRRRLGDLRGRAIVIGDGAWLAAGVMVLPGVRIGRGAIIGAGSVVTRDVDDDTLVAGVPAKPKKHYPAEGPPLSPTARSGTSAESSQA